MSHQPAGRPIAIQCPTPTAQQHYPSGAQYAPNWSGRGKWRFVTRRWLGSGQLQGARRTRQQLTYKTKSSPTFSMLHAQSKTTSSPSLCADALRPICTLRATKGAKSRRATTKSTGRKTHSSQAQSLSSSLDPHRHRQTDTENTSPLQHRPSYKDHGALPPRTSRILSHRRGPRV